MSQFTPVYRHKKRRSLRRPSRKLQRTTAPVLKNFTGIPIGKKSKFISHTEKNS